MKKRFLTRGMAPLKHVYPGRVQYPELNQDPGMEPLKHVSPGRVQYPELYQDPGTIPELIIIRRPV